MVAAQRSWSENGNADPWTLEMDDKEYKRYRGRKKLFEMLELWQPKCKIHYFAYGNFVSFDW